MELPRAARRLLVCTAVFVFCSADAGAPFRSTSVKELQAEVRRLQAEKSALEDDKKSLVQTVQNMLASNQSKAIQELQQDKAVLQDTLKKTRSSLEARIDNVEKHYGEAMKVVTQLESENSNLSQDPPNTVGKIKNLEQEVSVLREDKAHLTASLQAMLRRSENGDSSDSSTNKEDHEDSEDVKVTQLLRENNVELHQQVQTLNGQVKDESKQIEDLKKQLADETSEVTKMKQAINHPQQNATKDPEAWDLVHELQKRNLRMLDEDERLHGEINTLQRQVQGLKEDKEQLLNTLRGALSEHTQSKAAVTKSVASHEDQAKNVTNEVKHHVKRSNVSIAVQHAREESDKEKSEAKQQKRLRSAATPPATDAIAHMGEIAAMDSYSNQVARSLAVDRAAAAADAVVENASTEDSTVTSSVVENAKAENPRHRDLTKAMDALGEAVDNFKLHIHKHGASGADSQSVPVQRKEHKVVKKPLSPISRWLAQSNAVREKKDDEVIKSESRLTSKINDIIEKANEELDG